MKIVACSDAHLDWTTAGVARFDEIRDAMRAAADAAASGGADLFAFVGDLCDPDSGSVVLRCVEVAIGIATALGNCGIPTLWIAGNHDVVGDGFGTTSLSPLRALDFHTLVAEKPARFAWPGWSHDVIALPHVAGGVDYAAAFAELAAQQSKRSLVVFSHLTIPGIDPGEETNEMPRGAERALPIRQIATNAAVVVSGHYHERGVYRLDAGAQRVFEGPPTTNGFGETSLYVVGSLARLTFGEERNRPGYLLLEV